MLQVRLASFFRAILVFSLASCCGCSVAPGSIRPENTIEISKLDAHQRSEREAQESALLSRVVPGSSTRGLRLVREMYAQAAIDQIQLTSPGQEREQEPIGSHLLRVNIALQACGLAAQDFYDLVEVSETTLLVTKEINGQPRQLLRYSVTSVGEKPTCHQALLLSTARGAILLNPYETGSVTLVEIALSSFFLLDKQQFQKLGTANSVPEALLAGGDGSWWLLTNPAEDSQKLQQVRSIQGKFKVMVEVPLPCRARTLRVSADAQAIACDVDGFPQLWWRALPPSGKGDWQRQVLPPHVSAISLGRLAGRKLQMLLHTPVAPPESIHITLGPDFKRQAATDAQVINLGTLSVARQASLLYALPSDRRLKALILRGYHHYGQQPGLRYAEENPLLLSQGFGLAHCPINSLYGTERTTALAQQANNLVHCAKGLSSAFPGVPLILWARSAAANSALLALQNAPKLFARVYLEQPYIREPYGRDEDDIEAREWLGVGATALLANNSPPVLLSISWADRQAPAAAALAWSARSRQAGATVGIILLQTSTHQQQVAEERRLVLRNLLPFILK
jgi:hypothetical protein